MNIDIKKLNDQDIDEFVELIRVFEMENLSVPDDEHLRKVLTKADFIVMVDNEGGDDGVQHLVQQKLKSSCGKAMFDHTRFLQVQPKPKGNT